MLFLFYRIALLLILGAAYKRSFLARQPKSDIRVHHMMEDNPIYFEGMFSSALDKFNGVDSLDFCERMCVPRKEGKFGNKTIEFTCNAYNGKLLSPVRLVTFKGAGFDVYNLLVMPNKDSGSEFPVPILGIDIVVLPGSVIAALDYQPVNAHPDRFDGPFYKRLRDIHRKWSSQIPSGGSFPEVILIYSIKIIHFGTSLAIQQSGSGAVLLTLCYLD